MSIGDYPESLSQAMLVGNNVSREIGRILACISGYLGMYSLVSRFLGFLVSWFRRSFKASDTSGTASSYDYGVPHGATPPPTPWGRARNPSYIYIYIYIITLYASYVYIYIYIYICI